MRPKRRVTPTQDAPDADRDRVREINPVARRNYASGLELELWSDWCFCIGLWNGIDHVGAEDLSVAADVDAGTAAEEVQMPDADMVFDDELVGPPKKVEVTYLSSIINATALHHQGRETESHAAANFVAAEMTIDGLLEPPGQKGQQTVRGET